MAYSALSGINVVEYGQDVSGPYCARLLGDFGAEVLKVEDPGKGDFSRSLGPFPGDIPDSERSGLFLALNANKLGVTLNLGEAIGREIFQKLVSEADVLVENNPRTRMAEFGLDYESLYKINRRLIYVSITPFGQTAPYRDYKAEELVLLQMSGAGYYFPGDASPSEPPLGVGARVAEFTSGMCGATAAMFALIQREATGEGQHIDIASREAATLSSMNNLATFLIGQQKPTRFGGQMPRAPAHIMPCQDGYIQLECIEKHQWDAFLKLVGNPEWGTLEVFQDPSSCAEHWDALEPLLRSITAQYKKDDFCRAAQKAGVPCAPVNLPGDLLTNPHLKEREFFTTVKHPRAGRLQYVGAPFKLAKTPWRLRRPAPLLGEHNEEIFCNRIGYARKELAVMRRAGII